MKVSKFGYALLCVFVFMFAVLPASAEEVWQLTDLTVVEGDYIYNFEQDLREFPVVVTAVSETTAVLHQDELGMQVVGEYFVDETGWVGYTPLTFVGFTEDLVDHFFNTVDEFNVEIPETFWLQGEVNGSSATLMVEGYITMPYSIVAHLELR